MKEELRFLCPQELRYLFFNGAQAAKVVEIAEKGGDRALKSIHLYIEAWPGESFFLFPRALEMGEE